MITNMATAYETELERRQHTNFYQELIKRNKGQKEQERLQRAPLEELVEGIHDPQEREETIQRSLRDPGLYSQVLQDHLKKLDEEAKKADNLEDIINSAPIEALGQSLFYIGPAKETKEYGTVQRYNSYMILGRQIQEAQEKEDKEKLEKLSGNVKGLMRAYVLSDEYFDTSNEATKKFLEAYIKSNVFEEHAAGLFNQQSQKAIKYVTNKDHADEVRGYLKEVLADEAHRPVFYNVLFAPKQQE